MVESDDAAVGGLRIGSSWRRTAPSLRASAPSQPRWRPGSTRTPCSALRFVKLEEIGSPPAPYSARQPKWPYNQSGPASADAPTLCPKPKQRHKRFATSSVTPVDEWPNLQPNLKDRFQMSNTQTYQWSPPRPQPQPMRRKRRTFMWVFLVVQALFLAWLIGGIASASGAPADCGSLSAETCNDAQNVGAAIGVGIIFVFWAVVDIILGVTYAIIKLARR